MKCTLGVPFAEINKMKISHRKTKVIVSNLCRSVDFTPDLKLSNNPIEVVEEIKLLGLTIRSDLKWTTNTQNIISNSNKRLWMLNCFKNLGAEEKDLLEVYVKQLGRVAVPLQKQDLRRTRKLQQCTN